MHQTKNVHEGWTAHSHWLGNKSQLCPLPMNVSFVWQMIIGLWEEEMSISFFFPVTHNILNGFVSENQHVRKCRHSKWSYSDFSVDGSVIESSSSVRAEEQWEHVQDSHVRLEKWRQAGAETVSEAETGRRHSGQAGERRVGVSQSLLTGSYLLGREVEAFTVLQEPPQHWEPHTHLPRLVPRRHKKWVLLLRETSEPLGKQH